MMCLKAIGAEMTHGAKSRHGLCLSNLKGAASPSISPKYLSQYFFQVYVGTARDDARSLGAYSNYAIIIACRL
eukprot:1010207-Pelagomonas_calceolata.AAC.1